MKRRQHSDGLDRALRDGLGNLPAPDVGLRFHQQLRTRLLLEPPRRRLSRGHLLLRCYWVGALLASFLIVASLPWGPDLAAAPFWVAFSILVAVFWVPSLLLRRLGWAALLLDTLAESPEP